MQGAAYRKPYRVPNERIIPACAGNRHIYLFCIYLFWDHPRACGEQYEQLVGGIDTLGSSPRVRGAGLRPGRDRPLRGIIPACAGSSSRPSRRAQAGRDHPRVCGEQWRRKLTTSAIEGSFPRVRGAGSKVLHNAHIIGIIPACAGSSCAHASTFLFGWDHPRACGEQVESTITGHESPGSSPRMRGTAQAHVESLGPFGIIPAHAGNSRGMPCGRHR